jgi:ATP-binding cassette subfamily B protein/subfamily B ATP-binding cassette protein MsbA
MLSSLAVGALWGANIGVVYPFVEIVFDNQSPQEWINGEVSTMERQISAWEGASDTLAAHLAGADLAEGTVTERLSERLDADLKTEKRRLAVYNWMQPHVEAYLPHTPFKALLLIVGLLLLGTLLKDFFIVINMNLVGRLAQLTMFDLRKQFFRQTLSLDLAALGASKNSTLLSHFTYDLNCLTTGLTTLFGQALREPLKMVVCLTGACMISWRLLLLSLLVTPPALFLMHRLARSMKRANLRAMEEMSQLYGNLTETFTGILTVKAFTMEQFERNRFHGSAKEFFRKAMRIVFYNSLTKPITELLGIGVISLALVAGGHLVLTPATHLFGIRLCDRPPSLADLLLFYAFLAGVSDPARKLSSVFAVLQAGSASADRIFPLIDREPAISDPITPKKIQTPHRQLSVENVSFHYNREEPVLHHVDLKIDYGETIAIVGPNGCGKSTLINLLPRFYDPIEGRIKIDGIDVREVRRRDLRARIGMVTQKTHLFDDTVQNNIRYGSVGASDAEIIAAAKKAHAHRFITTALANGYETTVGQDGNLLSGGQRQRIALARAILRDPEILILDEATSQIDIESEELIHEALKEFARGRTAIIVTHRLSTIRLADRVVVIEAGEIKDVGRHEELLGRCPLYSRLHAIQFSQSA